jgi:primosomal protein N' (replication factor Y)
VGVVAADLSLHTGDYRAAETTFQLLTQVSGRAGRAALAGRVYIQTYNPDHYSVKFAQANSYADFYAHEIALRRQLAYPPFCQLFCVLALGPGEKNLILYLNQLAGLMGAYNRKGLFELIGPAPAVIAKVKDRYRWKLLIKSPDGEKLKNFVYFCAEKLPPPPDITISLTFDPVLII